MVKSIDLKRSRVQGVPGYVIICGGKLETDFAVPSPSMREFFMRWAAIKDPRLSASFEIAEELWGTSDIPVYPELLTFEKHLAGLASLIVVFVESPGAIAELAAFSLIPEVAEKLCVFVQQEHDEQGSFIKHGPINFLKETFPEPAFPPVHVYPWRTGRSATSPVLDEMSANDCVEEIHSVVTGALGRRRVARKLDGTVVRDRLLIAYELVGLFLCLKFSEIRRYLSALVGDVDASDVRRYVHVLMKLELLKKVPRGHEDYFLIADSGGYLKLMDLTAGVEIDKERTQFDVQAYYKAADSTRSRVIATNLVTQGRGRV